MMLAQAPVDISSLGGVGDFIGKYGFPALLVLVLLYGIWKMLEAAKDERDKHDVKDEAREVTRRVERETDREAHLAALDKQGARLDQNTSTLNMLTQTVDRLLDRKGP